MSPAAADALRKTNFTEWDWVIVAAYLLVSLFIGLRVKKYVSSMASYVGAGRAVGTRLGIATMAGTELGLITVMYSAEKGFTGGFAAFHIAFLAAVVTFFVGLTGFIVYRLRALEVLTIPEFYEKRFGRPVRVLGGIMLAFGGILNMGLFLKVGSMFIVGITGIADESWALVAVMTALLTLVLAYTVLGGMISVVVTDYVQFVVLAVGLLVATALAVNELGWQNIFDAVAGHLGEAGFDPFMEGSGFGVDYVVWMSFLGLVGCAIWPTAVARALAMESPAAVRKQYMWSSVSFLIRFLIPYFWGICALVFILTSAPDLNELYFPSGGENRGEGLSNLYAMPAFLGRLLPAGVIGIISAAMIAAFMSTHDSYLLCWSSVITQDVVASLTGDRMTTRGRVLCTRVSIVVIGGFIFYWGLFYEGTQEIWDYMAVTGAIYFSGAVVLLIAGLYFKGASSTGAVLALLTGITAILGLEPVQELLGITKLLESWHLADVTGARIGLLTISLTASAMVVGSLLFPDRRSREND